MQRNASGLEMILTHFGITSNLRSTSRFAACIVRKEINNNMIVVKNWTFSSATYCWNMDTDAFNAIFACIDPAVNSMLSSIKDFIISINGILIISVCFDEQHNCIDAHWVQEYIILLSVSCIHLV